MKEQERSEREKDLQRAVAALDVDQYLPQFIAQTMTAIREGHQLAVASQERSDRELVWFIALMGGGVFSVHQLFTDISGGLLLWCLIPWAGGIVCGVTSRVLGAELQNGNNLIVHDRVSRLGLLIFEKDRAVILEQLADVLKPEGSFHKRESRLRYLLWIVNSFYYLSYLGFMIGAIAAAWTVYVTRVP